MKFCMSTYIAADFDEDRDIYDKLLSINDNDWYRLSFSDAHDLKQARDTSLPCTIKSSLMDRLNASKTFVLIVGDKTKTVTKGKCVYCKMYYRGWCLHSRAVDKRSYVEFECEMAIRKNMKIVVLYNDIKVYKDKCPECIKDVGVHIPIYRLDVNGCLKFDISSVTNAISD